MLPDWTHTFGGAAHLHDSIERGKVGEGFALSTGEVVPPIHGHPRHWDWQRTRVTLGFALARSGETVNYNMIAQLIGTADYERVNAMIGGAR